MCAAENPLSAKMHANAMKLEKSGNVRGALEAEIQAARQSPDNFFYRGELARLLWVAGFVDRAQQECREAIKLAPDNVKCHFNYAVMLQAMGDPKGAIVEYEKVLKIYPKDVQQEAQTRFGLLQSLSLAGRSQDAVNQLDYFVANAKRFSQVLPEVADTAIKINQPGRAKELLKELAASGNPQAENLLYLAAAKDGDKRIAQSIQNKVLQRAPKDRRLYLIAAKLADEKGGIWLEELILTQAMKAVRNDGDLYAQLAGIYTHNFSKAKAAGDEKNAQAWLELADRALSFAEEIHVKAWQYRFAHAGVYALQGKHKQAEQVIEDLARQEPKNELVTYCRGRLRAFSNNPAAAARRNLKSLLGDGDKASAQNNPSEDGISLACSRAYFEKLGCGCHTAVLETKWKRSGGVLYAKVISEHPAVGLIVHRLGDEPGFKGRIISAAATISEKVTRLETETVQGLGALSLNVAAPEEQEEPPLIARINPPELQRL